MKTTPDNDTHASIRASVNERSIRNHAGSQPRTAHDELDAAIVLLAESMEREAVLKAIIAKLTSIADSDWSSDYAVSVILDILREL